MYKSLWTCTCQRNGYLEVISEQTETLNESFKITLADGWLQLTETKQKEHSQCSRKEVRKRKGCFKWKLLKCTKQELWNVALGPDGYCKEKTLYCHLAHDHFEPGEEAPQLILTWDKSKRKGKLMLEKKAVSSGTEGTRWWWGSKSKHWLTQERAEVMSSNFQGILSLSRVDF